jgi:hypothetical protein
VHDIRKVIKEYEERSTRASNLYKKHHDAKNAISEKKTEKEVLKVVRQFERVRDFDMLEMKFTAIYKQNEYRTPKLRTMKFDIRGDSFRVRFVDVELNPFGKRKTWYYDGECIAKKNLMAMMKDGYGFYLVPDRVAPWNERKFISSNTFSNAGDFIKQYKKAVEESK